MKALLNQYPFLSDCINSPVHFLLFAVFFVFDSSLVSAQSIAKIKAIEIIRVSGKNSEVLVQKGAKSPPKTKPVNVKPSDLPKLTNPNMRLVVVPPGSATLSSIDDKGKPRFSIGIASSETKRSEYFYRCKSKGETTIAWEKRLKKDKIEGCARAQVQLKGVGGVLTLKRNSNNQFYASTQYFAENQASPLEQPVLTSFYCSALQENGKGWGVNASSSYTGDLFSINDPCRVAIQQCQKISTQGGGDCFVDDVGQREHTEQGLELSLLCNNRDRLAVKNKTGQEIEAELNRLASQASQEQGSSCELTIKASDETVIKPQEDGTIVYVGELGTKNGNYAVVLAGKAKFEFPSCSSTVGANDNTVTPFPNPNNDPDKPPESDPSLGGKRGDRIDLQIRKFGEIQDPGLKSNMKAQSMPELLSQRGKFIITQTVPIETQPTSSCPQRPITPNERQEVYKSLSVKSLIDPESFGDVRDDEIGQAYLEAAQRYKQLVNKQFYDPNNSRQSY
jgi:hypothetical protein